MEWPKLQETSFSKIVSSLAILGPVGAYSYVCIVTKKVVEIPQSFIVLIAILLGVKAVPAAVEMFKSKKEN